MTTIELEMEIPSRWHSLEISRSTRELLLWSTNPYSFFKC